MITSPNVVGVTQSQQQQNGLDRLNQSMQQYAANKIEKQRNAVALLNQVLSGPYRGAVLANKDLAMGLFSTMSDALGTRDPSAILQFVQGNANTPLTQEEQQGLTQYLYAAGALQGQESATQAPDDLARLRALWTKPQESAPAPAPAPAPTPAPASSQPADTSKFSSLIRPEMSPGAGAGGFPTQGSYAAYTIDGQRIGWYPSEDEAKKAVLNFYSSPAHAQIRREIEAYFTPKSYPAAAPGRSLSAAVRSDSAGADTTQPVFVRNPDGTVTLASPNVVVGDTSRPSTGVGAGTASPAPAAATPAAPAGKSPASTPAPAPGGKSTHPFRDWLVAEQNAGRATWAEPVNAEGKLTDVELMQRVGPDTVRRYRSTLGSGQVPAVQVAASGSQSAAGPSTTPQSAEFQAASAEDQLAARYLGGDTTLTDRDRKQAEYYISQIHNRGQKSLRTTFSSTGAKQWDSTVLQTAANYLNIGQPENGGIKDNPALSALFIDKPGIEKKKAEAQIALDFAQAEEAVKNAGYLDAKTQGYGVELGIEAAKLTMQQAMANSVDFAKAVDLFKMEAEPWLAGLTEVRKALAKDPFNKDLKNREQEYLRMMQESPNWQNIQKAITFIESRTMNVPTTLGLDFIKKYGFFSTKVNGEYTFPLLDFTGLGMGTSTGADNVTGSGGAAGEAAAAGLPDVYE